MTGDPPLFVVGCARSGTTLLRVMLDAHPLLAVPPESHFIPGLAPGRLDAPFDVDEILSHPRVASWELDRDAVHARLPGGARSYADAIDAVFRTYAATTGKVRWADKTPGYVEHLPLLAQLFPTARFVHVIRDGREVAASLAEWPWGPASPVAGAFWWRSKVTRGRDAGHDLGPRYHELRLEDLVRDPEGALRSLCTAIELPYDPAMLRYPESAGARMAKADETYLSYTHPHLAKPPTADLRDWRAGLSPSRQAAVEAACGPLLRELGYASATPRPSAIARAWVLRVTGAASTAPRDLRARLQRRSSDV